jgi:hypothetical protein
MKRRRIVVAVVGTLIGLPVLASMPAPIPLRELYEMAETVAVVEVLEGRVVSAGGDTCGARYKGRVVEGTKNATAGTTIEFGYLPQLKVGGAYLLLLGPLDNEPIPGLPEFLARCRSVLPSSAMLAHRRGAMEISGDTSAPDRRASWTVRPVKYVIYPLGTRTTLVDGQKQFWFSDLIKRMSERR